MEDTNLSDKDKNKKKKKARKALVLLLRNLRSKCGSFKKVDEWYGFLTKHLDPVFSEFDQEISTDAKEKIKEARNVVDTTRDGINRCCKNLRKELENIVKTLPGGSTFPQFLLGTLIIGAITAGVLVTYLNRSAVTIHIINKGCAPIRPLLFIPVSLPGIELPTKTILDGEEATAKVPPLKVNVDGTKGSRIKLSAFNFSMDFEFYGEGIDLLFDGNSLLGTKTDVDLGKVPNHELVVECML